MSSILAAAFDHHVWATVQVLDTCLGLREPQLETTVPGTYGSIIGTLRHLVDADVNYLAVLTDSELPPIDEDHADLATLRAAMDPIAAAWASIVQAELDPDVDVVRHRDDGSEGHAPLGIRLAQALHHGTDHRSQICTALTSLGMEPPEIDVWAFGAARGVLSETEPTT